MFIEDYILEIAGYGKSLSVYDTPPLPVHAEVFFNSIAVQLTNGSALTEKQGTLSLKLLRNNLSRLCPTGFPDLLNDLDSPQWKMPFRVIPIHKTIKVQPYQKYGKAVFLEFPFDEKLVQLLRSWHAGNRYKGQWDSDIRKWVLTLCEDNILMIGDQILPHGFTADEEFMDLLEESQQIRNNIDMHLPMIVTSNSTFKLTNQSSTIPQLDTQDVVNALFTARKYGITTWDDTIEDLVMDKSFNPITRGVIKYSSADTNLWFDSTEHKIEHFDEVLTHSGPTLIIVPGGSEFENVKQWSDFATSIGISKEQQSVMFRLPNSNATLNTYVKKEGLNNPVTEHTKIVFVNTKIPKPLVKNRIKFPTVINLGFYDSMHFTLSTTIATACNLIYYSTKRPSRRAKWTEIR